MQIMYNGKPIYNLFLAIRRMLVCSCSCTFIMLSSTPRNPVSARPRMCNQTIPQKAAFRGVQQAGMACRAAGTALALVIGFLPWKGCSQGGFYDTGVPGEHGDNCQAIYQPAAAAEARFAASLRMHNSSSTSSSTSISEQLSSGAEQQTRVATAAPKLLTAPAIAITATTPQAAQTRTPNSSSNDADVHVTSSSGSEAAADAEAMQQDPQHVSVAEQMQQVPDAVKDLARDVLREDNRLRTKQLVDDAWQALE